MDMGIKKFFAICLKKKLIKNGHNLTFKKNNKKSDPVQRSHVFIF